MHTNGNSFSLVDKVQKTIHFIIDGPSLAYHVLYRLLAQKSSVLNGLNTIPSSKELGEGFILFLDELQENGAEVEHIFFDGFLPPQKQTTRLKRLDQSLKDLYLFHARHVHGFESSEDSNASGLSPKIQLFSSKRKSSQDFHGLPSPPFLVPAILDALRNSSYAARTEIVSEEADVYCARAARDRGGVILTSDSDMLVYDLGRNGAVAFLSYVCLTGEEPIGMQKPLPESLHISVWRPSDIAKRLGSSSLTQIAFEINQDPYLTLNAAVELAKNAKNSVEFLRFKEEYDVDSITAGPTKCFSDNMGIARADYQHFDPRVAELFFQVASLSREHSSSMYLPFLIEDPTRSTAWAPSSHLRALAYQILISHFNNQHKARTSCDKMTEYVRKGTRFIPEKIPLKISTEDFEEEARALLSSFHSARLCIQHATTTPSIPSSPPTQTPSQNPTSTTTSSSSLLYHLLALLEINTWHLTSHSKPKRTSIRSIKRILSPSGTSRLRSYSWADIHLAAQIHGVLYSLRILRQVLLYVRSRPSARGPQRDSVSLATGCAALWEVCEGLPPLTTMMVVESEEGSSLSEGTAVERLIRIMYADLEVHDDNIGGGEGGGGETGKVGKNKGGRRGERGSGKGKAQSMVKTSMGSGGGSGSSGGKNRGRRGNIYDVLAAEEGGMN